MFQLVISGGIQYNKGTNVLKKLERVTSLIAYVRGTLEYIDEDAAVIDVNGVGYQVFCAGATLEKLPRSGSPCKIYTYTHVREDAVLLYGFLSVDELKMFHKLISVSGIGPKGALGILNAMDPAALCRAVITEDIQSLSKAPGIGKKTAGRIVLELKDKLKTTDAIGVEYAADTVSPHADSKQEAVEALTALGYTQSDAASVVFTVAEEHMTAEQIIKLALKKIGTFK